MLGGKNTKPLGYTIVEVMIVLAISGIMFLIAATFISGKQAHTSFRAGVNEMASQIQDIIEQVTDGKYSDVPFNCSVGGSTLTITANASQAQGSNYQCVFLGKFMYFYDANGPSNYEVFSLAGERSTAANQVTSLANAKVTAVIGGGIDLTAEQTIPQNLQVGGNTKITVNSGTSTSSPYGFGFVQSLGASSDTNNGGPNAPLPGTNCSQSSQRVCLVYVSGLPANQGEGAAKGLIDNSVQDATSASICLTDGTNYATISIGDSSANSNQLSVNVVYDGATSC